MVVLSQRLRPFRALVLGDFLLDAYTTGKVRRISPEAPVPVMEVQRQESLPGGAGNVVLNLQSLGGEVICCGRIGEDAHGELLQRLLSRSSIDTKFLCIEKGYATPVKTRFIADSQQLLRVDIETISPLAKEVELYLLKVLEEEIKKADIIAISDYGKGCLTRTLLSFVFATARKWNIPTIVDPKGIDFTKYAGATVLKPNLSEAYQAAKLDSLESLDRVAVEIFAQVPIDLLLVTRSEAGMSLFRQTERQDFPVISKEVKDVTGAGDTVLATLCLALANQLAMPDAVQLANLAAGIAIERVGCVQVTKSELLRRAAKAKTVLSQLMMAPPRQMSS